MRKRKLSIIVVMLLLFATGIIALQTNASGKEEVSLTIPPLLEYELKDKTKFFTLIAQESRHEFSPDLRTKTLSYGDLSYLGPTIRVRHKDKIAIQVVNKLGTATTLHQHGLHIPASDDGGIYQLIAKNSTWTSDYTISQVAGTFWYHPHREELTGYQVAMGLAGLMIVDDEHSDSLPLPQEYGVDDIPLIIQDKIFSNQSIRYSDNMPEQMMGNIGNTIITNGRISPTFTANKSLLRFRILNGSSFGVHRYYFEDNRRFSLIANDAGLLEKPVSVKFIELSPSERREILVDISDLGTSETIQLLAKVRNGRTSTALSIEADVFQQTNTVVPELLVTLPKLNINNAKKQTFVLGGGRGPRDLTINGKFLNHNRVDVRVPVNTTEVWTIRNASFMMGGILHSFHPHHGSFQIISLNNKPPPPELRGWKDTVLLYPGDSVKIAMAFPDYTGLYMFHCHRLEHEDAGMMGIFEVVG